jgi:predicted AlkP superfamily phosphohydrolase/phosphomutase
MIYPLTYEEYCVGNRIRIKVITPDKSITTEYPKGYSLTYKKWTVDEIFDKIYQEEQENT